MSAEIKFESGAMTVYAGGRRLGSIFPRKGRLDAYDVEGVYIASFHETERRDAMRAVADADCKRREIAGATA